ncbi:Shikimate kinase [Xenorhabdus mauleonii]|uniref:Shikimate kinase n=1 Tax=Xenorhabdus mauleonii TaxID=351675 RepID=A0A1I3QTF6_9GAMM|nr:AAA family ATPase [Xenorhabdus mauleonii]PHM37264.1 Shikimate kinase [Xenorhabdus mauleonii]SFJ37185.1 shikimate kinase [Xenorhabdus mauleonii]
MKRILITGMSGTGKSSVIVELIRRGYQAVDLDTPEWSHWVSTVSNDGLTPREGQDWVWKEEAVRHLLRHNKAENLFVSGCAENMTQFYDLIDIVILLSAPRDTILERLSLRSGNAYGQSLEDRRKVIELIDMIEPMLRQSATFEFDTQQPIATTVDEIIAKTV